MEERLIEIIFNYSSLELKDYLNRLGFNAEITASNELIMRNPFLNKSSGIVWETSDYSTRGAILAFIIAGEFWTKAFPTLMDKIKAEWTKKR